MKTVLRSLLSVSALAILTLVHPPWGYAAPAGGLPAQAGPYRLEVSTDPNPIRTGPATVRAHVTDPAGEAVTGAEVQILTQMPGMPMGERTESALPEPGQPGVYTAPANFRMAGAWTIHVRVSAAQGSGETTLRVRTGQNTAGTAAPVEVMPVAAVVVVLGLVAFVLYRMRRTGQRLNLSGLRSWPVIVTILLLVAVYLGSAWAVRRFRKPGHMSVLEAQAMDMTVMKPPLGAVPVAAMAAKRQPIDATVSYTGSAVAFADQDVSPRVTGWITWMPFYPGNRVRRGQLLARLDAQELSSRVNEQLAARAMAEHGRAIARTQYQQALGARAQAEAQVREARSDLAGARGELAAIRQEVVASEEERSGAQADLESAQTGVDDTQAQLAAAQADQEYWSAQLRRSQELQAKGAISQQEYQRDRAQAEGANAKVRQAQARLQQVNAGIRAAQSRIRRADAMVAAAQAKVAEMTAKLESGQAKIEQAAGNARALGAAAETARHEIAHTQAGVRQAEAQVATASVVRGYTEIRAAADGIVTQRLISPGVLVNPGQPILRIAQIQPIRLQANVAESDLPRIRVGNRVRVRTMSGAGRITATRVTAVFPAVDPTARTAIVEALVPNTDGQFLPGQYLSMEITTSEQKNALVVPSGALVWQPKPSDGVVATEQTSSVWVLTAGQPQRAIYTCTMHPEVKQDKPGKCPT